MKEGVEQQVKISKLERRLPEDIPSMMPIRQPPSPPMDKRDLSHPSPVTTRSTVSRIQTILSVESETVPWTPLEEDGPTYAPPSLGFASKVKFRV